CRRLRPTRRAFAVVTNVGDAMDAAVSQTNVSAAYGQVVWSWRRDRGVKFAGIIPRATVATNAAHRGEHEVRRKAIAWGMSECSPLNLYASVPFLCARAHETAGAARTPAPPRPLFLREGRRICRPRAKMRREIARLCPLSSRALLSQW